MGIIDRYFRSQLPAMPQNDRVWTDQEFRKIEVVLGNITAFIEQRFGDGTYQNPLYLGGNYIWIDTTSKLRLKVGSLPTSATDGTIVGTQS